MRRAALGLIVVLGAACVPWSALAATLYRPAMEPADREVVWCVGTAEGDSTRYRRIFAAELADCWRTETPNPEATVRLCDAVCTPDCVVPCPEGSEVCGPYVSSPANAQSESLTCARVYDDAGTLVATNEAHPIGEEPPPPPPPPPPAAPYRTSVRVTVPTTGKALPDGAAVVLGDRPEWAVRECELQVGAEPPTVLAATSATLVVDVPLTGQPGDSFEIRSRCKANAPTWGAYGLARVVIPEPEPPPPPPPPPPPITTPPITGVVLRACGQGTPPLASFESGVLMTKTAAELGSPACLTAEFMTAAASVGIAYEPAPGEPVTIPHAGENSAPFELFGNWDGTNPRGNLAHPGRHRAVLTPCSVAVAYVDGQTCVGAGGTEGPAFELLFDLVAPPPIPEVEPDAPLVEPGPVEET